MSSTTSTKVTLQSNDSEQFTVDRKVILLSGLLKDLLEDLPAQEAARVIPIPECSGAVLEKVLEWCERYCDEVEADFDSIFLSVGLDELIDLTNAANYLEVELLLARCCKSLAERLTRKTTEEMREMLGIVSDFAPGEEERIREENDWVRGETSSRGDRGGL